MPVVLRNANIIKEEREHVQALWMVGEKVKDPPVLLDMRFRVRLQSMHHVWELHSIPYEEDREVVSHQIKVTLTHKKK